MQTLACTAVRRTAKLSITTATNTPGCFLKDAGMVNGMANYSAVTATNTAGESATSPQIRAWPVSAAPLTFNYGITGNQLQLSWPADHLGWRLQTQSNSLGTNWLDVAGSALTNLLLIPISSNAPISVFYRLVYP